MKKKKIAESRAELTLSDDIQCAFVSAISDVASKNYTSFEARLFRPSTRKIKDG